MALSSFFSPCMRRAINCHQIQVIEAPMGSESEGKWDIRIPMCIRFENYPGVLRVTHSFTVTELLLFPVRIILQSLARLGVSLSLLSLEHIYNRMFRFSLIEQVPKAGFLEFVQHKKLNF